MSKTFASWKTVAVLLFLFAVPAFAEASAAADRKAIVDDPRVVEALRGAIGTPELSEAIGRTVGIMMYEDNALTRNESDLFVELMDNVDGNIEITPPMGDAFMIPHSSEAARTFLSLSSIPDLNELWLAGPLEMKKLVDVTILNPQVRGQVQHYIANQLYLRWRTSNYVNNYSPLRTTLSTAYTQWREAGPETLALARALLYESLVELDAAVEDKVPNEIYDHLQS
jgi:hypothetical protein